MEIDVVLKAWECFVERTVDRFKEIKNRYPDYVLSEETFRLELGFALSEQLGSSSNVFAEFPCDKSATQKLDLFLLSEKGVCFEIKFLREIPSGHNAPFTQHYGSVLADLLKLELFSESNKIKCFVLVCNSKFEKHLIGQGLPLQHPGKEFVLDINLESLQKTATKEIEKRLGKEIPQENAITLKVWRSNSLGNYYMHLIEVI